MAMMHGEVRNTFFHGKKQVALSPTLESGGQNQKRPTSGRFGYITLPTRGSPSLHKGGQNQKIPRSGHIGYITPAVWGPPHRYRAVAKIRTGPQVGGRLATSTLLSAGSPTLQREAQNQKRPTIGRFAYITLGLGGLQRFIRADKIRRGPQLGRLATLALPSRKSPTLQDGGQNQKTTTNLWFGYNTLAFWGVPCRLRGPQHFKTADKIRRGPKVGTLAASPLPARGSPSPKSGG